MSYGLIAERLKVSKSTLSGWLKDIPYSPNELTLSRIKSGQLRYGEIKRAQRIAETSEIMADAIKEVGELSKRDLWMLGIGLWLGEGSKTTDQMRFVNSDPRIIRIIMRWLHEICLLTTENITVAMHLYSDLDESVCRNYWSDLIGLPCDRFRKTQIDRRQDKNVLKKGRSPYGTLHISVVANGDTEKGARLTRRVKGWMDGVSSQD